MKKNKNIVVAMMVFMVLSLFIMVWAINGILNYEGEGYGEIRRPPTYEISERIYMNWGYNWGEWYEYTTVEYLIVEE